MAKSKNHTNHNQSEFLLQLCMGREREGKEDTQDIEGRIVLCVREKFFFFLIVIMCVCVCVVRVCVCVACIVCARERDCIVISFLHMLP